MSVQDKLNKRRAKLRREHKAQLRREILRKKLRRRTKDALIDMLVYIHGQIWKRDAKDYPDAEVNGADVIDAVSGTFMDRGMGPKEIP